MVASATQGSSNPIYISRLHVRNYRSIVDAEFTFDPQCNILIGQNNSGKSNIMRALNVALGRDGDRISVDDYNDPKEDVLIKVTVKGLSQTSNVMKSLSETYQDAKYTLEEQEFTLGLLYPTVAKRLEDKAKREATSKRLTTTPHDDQPGELTDTEPYRMNPRYGAVYKLLPTVLPERRNKYDINGNLDFFATTNAPHLASSLRADLTLV